MNARRDGPSADEVIRALGLVPHPEGGHYVETLRDPATIGAGRSVGTAIYYLLRAGERSAWHRVIDATKIWHWYAGDPLDISIAEPDGQARTLRLGTDFGGGERPQVIVPAGHWQSAIPHGAWTLVGCTVSPGFEFASFEMAPAGWSPGDPRGGG
jgi:predicted cupin superfamily sugar epimerase